MKKKKRWKFLPPSATATDSAPATLKAAPAMDGPRWTEEVDDLVDAGDVDAAIALLESVVSGLSTSAAAPATDLRLATALGDLAGLHASRGDTLRADELRARAIALRSRAAAPWTGTLGFVSPFSLSLLLLQLVVGRPSLRATFQLFIYCFVGQLLELPLGNCLVGHLSPGLLLIFLQLGLYSVVTPFLCVFILGLGFLAASTSNTRFSGRMDISKTVVPGTLASY